MASTKIEKQDDVTTEGTLTSTPDATPESASTEKPESEATLTPSIFLVDVVGLIGSATPADDGTLTADQAKVNELFRSLPKDRRNEAKALLAEEIRSRMLELVTNPGDARKVALVKGLLDVEKGLSAAAPKATPTPTDPRPGMIRALFTLKAAEAALSEQLGTLTEAEAATVADEADVERVTKAALPKASHTFTGERRDIGAHIVQAFENEPSGTFLTVAKIRAKVTEAYPDPADRPSSGAIEIRLFPKAGKDGKARLCTVQGVTPTPAVPNEHPNGATKV